MNDLLPQAYLLGLIALLGVAAVVVARQTLRVRRDELAMARLGGNDKAGGSPRDVSPSTNWRPFSCASASMARPRSISSRP